MRNENDFMPSFLKMVALILAIGAFIGFWLGYIFANQTL